MMLDRFLEFIKEKQLFSAHEKVLLAVSGGIDSMVLLHLFEKSGYDYGIVHCNFQLRGDESEQDERFVRQQVLIHGVPSFFARFETEEFARLNGISIEMAARDLRYEFFEKTRKENNFNYIVTAHHQDDLIETFFLNLSRKTGIKGLTGIKEKSGYIIRPLLFTSREEIEKYARREFIDFREDSSNNEVVFQRNFLRHRILPLFSEMNPAFSKNILATIENLKEAEKIYSGYLEMEIEKVSAQNENGRVIFIEKLKNVPFPKNLLFEMMTEYNFNSSVIEKIAKGLDTESGRQYFSKTHRAVKDRENIYVTPLTKEEERIFYLESDDIELFAPMDLIIEKTNSKNFKIIKDRNVACLDLDKLEFPLLIRRWEQGDYFQPLGMVGFKKVSDFFIDEKIPLHEKENTWLLCSGKKIVWIMGRRIDNRFKITPETKNILKIEIRKAK
jgi:tRNA(Ile)-lysidine synthase